MNKHCIALLQYQTSSAKEPLCESVQHKCQLSDLNTNEMAPVTRGKETFVVENTHRHKQRRRKKTLVLLLRVDKETLKGIK